MKGESNDSLQGVIIIYIIRGLSVKLLYLIHSVLEATFSNATNLNHMSKWKGLWLNFGLWFSRDLSCKMVHKTRLENIKVTIAWKCQAFQRHGLKTFTLMIVRFFETFIFCCLEYFDNCPYVI